MVKEGRVRAIGVSSPQPHPIFPDVLPLSRHKLLPDFNFDIWIGVQVPKSTPEPVVLRVNQAMTEVLKNPEVRKSFEATGSQIARPMGPSELDKLYVSEIERYKAIFKSINLPPQ
jgi:tripartite-type tricarboxylate transporter receptor subunit TctC